jgi:hypothetical protein
MRENPWIAAVAKIKDFSRRRFQPKYHSADGYWVITLSPAFETCVSDKG